MPPNKACSNCLESQEQTPYMWESARFRSIFLALSFFCSQAESTPPTRSQRKPLKLSKSHFSKIIFEKWERKAEKRLIFGVPHNISAIFWQFFSLLWEIF